MLVMGIFNAALISIGIMMYGLHVCARTPMLGKDNGAIHYALMAFTFRQQWFCSNIVLNVMGVILL